VSRRRLPASFFGRSAVEVAPDLLGRVFVRELPGGERLAGRIAETEAYEPGDPASHGARGKTARNASMFGPPGHLYVYFTYGSHWMINVVTGANGEASAVLLRALEPLEGVTTMIEHRGGLGRGDLRELCSGPGKLAQAFGVDGRHDGASVTRRGVDVWIASGNPLEPSSVVCGPRVGISKAIAKPWRFMGRADRFVSQGRPRPPGTR
jgi:DNA-3-methyladenine glycosylase